MKESVNLNLYGSFNPLESTGFGVIKELDIGTWILWGVAFIISYKVYLLLDALPLTPFNGALRGALPEPPRLGRKVLKLYSENLMLPKLLFFAVEILERLTVS